MSDRRSMFGDAAVRVIAQGGMRALTHRSVDEEAGLPPGSVNYYAPTRAKLLQLAFTSAIKESMVYAQSAFAPIVGVVKPTPDQVIDCTVDFIFTASVEGRGVTVARNVLNAEAQYDNDLMEQVLTARQAFIEFTDHLMTASAATLQERNPHLIVALVDGLITQQTMIVRPMLAREDIRAALERCFGFYDEEETSTNETDGAPADPTN